MISTAILRQCLIDLIGADLGEYQRPDGPNIPAFWVYDRPLPGQYKVVTMDELSPWVPALEGVLDPNTEPRPKVKNTRFLAYDEIWTFRLVQHDRRQPMREAVRRIMCHFEQTPFPTYLAGSDLYHAQYTFEIPILSSLEVS